MNCSKSSELCREAAVCRAGRSQQLEEVESGAWACGFMVHDYSFRLHRAAHNSEHSETGVPLDFAEQPQKHEGPWGSREESKGHMARKRPSWDQRLKSPTLPSTF